MKQVYRAGLGLAVVLSLSLFSCEEKTDVTSSSESVLSNEENIETGEIAKLEFSKALVKAVQDKDVRAFLKAEALSQYDGDYDILYALVKDKPVVNGESFEKILSKYTSTNFKTWSEKAPLMTIFVPKIKNFSAETWNLETQIPDVVLVNEHLKNKGDKLVTFSSDLRQYEVDSKEAPTFPVLVIKENERIIAKSKLDQGAKKNSTLFAQKSQHVINENNSHEFFFIGDVNPKTVNTAKNRIGSDPAINVIQFFNYHKSGFPNEPGSQRDWVYYRIWPKFNDIELVNPNINGGVDYDWSQGKLGDVYYTERLTRFKFVNSNGLQAVTDNWYEGNLEFHIIVSFIYRDGNMENDLKVFFCSPNDLKDSNNNPIEYNPNVEINQWDMYRYGDEWKFSILEHDAGGNITKTISSKSNFGYNFEAAAEFKLFLKFGVKFGTTGNFEKSKSEVIQIASESDQLGDARVLFDNPVIIPGSDTRYSVSTGAVNFSIEPILKLNDPRPYPYID